MCMWALCATGNMRAVSPHHQEVGLNVQERHRCIAQQAVLGPLPPHEEGAPVHQGQQGIAGHCL